MERMNMFLAKDKNEKKIYFIKICFSYKKAQLIFFVINLSLLIKFTNYSKF